MQQWEKVLGFWFDGDLSNNYKEKWFAQNDKIRAKTDAEIKTQFGPMLIQAEEENLIWQDIYGTNGEPRGALALVLLLDQFSRHIYRDHPNKKYKLEHNDKLSTDIVECCVQKGVVNRLTIPQRVFLLMPFRHSPTQTRMNFVLDEIKDMEAVQVQQNQLLTKFRRNTIRRIQNAKSTNRFPEDILEHHEFQSDLSKLSEHRVVRCIREFIKDYKKCRNIIVSLSGGVDSMVITRILAYIRTELNIKVVVVHIDYGNRDESKYECEFLKE